MQTFHLNAGWKRWVPTFVVVAAGTALLPWQPKAQTQASPQEHQEAPSGSFAQKPIDPRTIQVGDYTLKHGDAQGFDAVVKSTGPDGPYQFHENVSFTLDIKGSSKDNLMLLHGVKNIHALDDRGRTVRGTDLPHFTSGYSGHALDESIRRETLCLATEDGAKSLKTLEGNLVFDTGTIRVFTFSGEELRPNTSKKLGQVTVTIDFAQQEPHDTRVYVTCLVPRFHPSRNPIGPPRPITLDSEPMQVEVVGTDGVTYRSSSHDEHGGGAPPPVSPGGIDNGAPSMSIAKSHVALGFYAIPNGVHVKSVVFHIVELQGDVLSVPFKFTDVPLPDKL